MRTDFAPSPYQEAILDFVRHGMGHGMIEAVAGSGKSTTLLKALELLPQTASVAFLAFNREIARHLRAQAPKQVKVCTLHSLGHEAVRNAHGDAITLDGHKTARIGSRLAAETRRTGGLGHSVPAGRQNEPDQQEYESNLSGDWPIRLSRAYTTCVPIADGRQGPVSG